MATVNLTKETFGPTVGAEGTVLVDLWASWCGPCRMFAPIFEQASETHGNLTFAKVDTERETALASELGIMSIPTLMVFRDGILLYSQPGALPERSLEDLIEKVAELDMDEVRRDVLERSTAGVP